MNPPIVTIFKNSPEVYAYSKFQITEWNIDDLVLLDGLKIFDSDRYFYEVENVVKKGWAYL